MHVIHKYTHSNNNFRKIICLPHKIYLQQNQINPLIVSSLKYTQYIISVPVILTFCFNLSNCITFRFALSKNKIIYMEINILIEWVELRKQNVYKNKYTYLRKLTSKIYKCYVCMKYKTFELNRDRGINSCGRSKHSDCSLF